MPELPEVELVAKSLNTLVSGRKIVVAELRREKLTPDHTASEFGELLAGASVNFVHRRGKHVLFDLDNARTLITHLRMSGRFMLLPLEREFPKYTHACFYLQDELRLVFEDQRHFGMMKIVETARLHEAKELAKLAPEPFSDDFTVDYFKTALKSSKKSLKEVLLDQTKVLGLGNIYASEAMFLARANPRTPANKLSGRKAAALFETARGVLAESIAHGSATEVDPENIDGSYFGGANEDRWRVYDRENEPCLNCETQIRRITQGGRSTYFCPKCQR